MCIASQPFPPQSNCPINEHLGLIEVAYITPLYGLHHVPLCFDKQLWAHTSARSRKPDTTGIPLGIALEESTQSVLVRPDCLIKCYHSVLKQPRSLDEFTRLEVQHGFSRIEGGLIHSSPRLVIERLRGMNDSAPSIHCSLSETFRINVA